MKETSFPGHELREKREKLGLSLYEAFRRTRVPAPYLAAMERGDMRGLPAACYAIGFIRSYCEFLELNAERYVDSYRACLRPVCGNRFLSRPDGGEFRIPDWVQEVMTWAVVASVVLLGWITYTVVFQPSAPVERRVSASTVEMAAPPPLSAEDDHP
ncbi:MAG TPA: helix-turn-helix domain-containing protein [Candidatus Hydrogenedentes bacterium]|nr:helix-turn-helix domain-containing protein [Candidatus Hydrogenedentota bacterium]HOV74403.1 helix-turn-helix domain-containing protein [Candidatus Hydrogenedentota bacterium]HPC16661.1 helix-turn-helix domain-containing protein [Candidatus Hydrogenedentota bacterium]HRT21211.1 helix-turn-helix domain-containing protein [Candidatus Hydrogenedentota bacterium]HRT65303.1 helix-turn-helix domain-containing protein [Candidatus Hydrogenedentota bacterium]